jgi:hypothetical protein
VKKHYRIFFFAAPFLLIGFISCKKINEATDLGGDLIPAVDNVNTFEVALNAVTNNMLYNDTSKVNYSDLVAAGDLNDPEFGTTHAGFHFNITPVSLGTNPFLGRDTTKIIDSVVLSLQYDNSYGDTLNGFQTLHVYEIAPNQDFKDTVLYKYADPSTDFPTTGSELGSATFTAKSAKDSIRLIRAGDTTTVNNVVRIRLDNSLGERFAQYDTTASMLSGGYHSDTTSGSIFRKLFAGFAIKADNGSNMLSYFDLTATSQTRLTVYYQIVHNNGKRDTLSTDFNHRTNGQANYVKMTPASNWATYLNNGTPDDDKLYIQSAPSGSYASINVPDLSTLGNKVIHKAEIITSVLPSAGADKFTPPPYLFLDYTNSGTPDTAFLFDRDINLGVNQSIDLSLFGGNLKNNQYRFDITRYVQGIVTRHTPNDTLRLYAPLRTQLFVPLAGIYVRPQIEQAIGMGRVVLGGGNFVNADQRLRLRIIYSNL